MISMALSRGAPACALPLFPLTLQRYDIKIWHDKLLQVVAIYCKLFAWKYRFFLVSLYLQTSYNDKQ